MYRSMLTTTDNPFSPFDEFDEWYAFDTRMGYHTPSLLARVEMNSYELSEADSLRVNELAVDEIVEANVSGMHKKVTKEIEEKIKS